jgi:hypothetical protein
MFHARRLLWCRRGAVLPCSSQRRLGSCWWGSGLHQHAPSWQTAQQSPADNSSSSSSSNSSSSSSAHVTSQLQQLTQHLQGCAVDSAKQQYC